jgi:hypothetical protein
MGLKIIEMGEARDALELACDDPSRVVLLRPRYHRPRRRTAKSCDEFAPSHPSLPKGRPRLPHSRRPIRVVGTESSEEGIFN